MGRVFYFNLVSMTAYEKTANNELKAWQKKMMRNPSLFNRASRNLQSRINRMIPEKVHEVITTTMKQMIRAVLFGAELTTSTKHPYDSLETCEAVAMEKINFYRKTAAVEGGITGAGGIVLGLADFPILLSLKLKLLFEIASVYGFNIASYKERVYILHIFQLAFSSHQHRKKIYLSMVDWREQRENLPEDINQFDWRTLQQEYRDYIDLAKMAQLVPLIGAPVGIVANYQLVKKLGTTAINAYRMRWFEEKL